MYLILQKHLYCSFGSIFWESLFLHNEVRFSISVNHLPTIKTNNQVDLQIIK